MPRSSTARLGTWSTGAVLLLLTSCTGGDAPAPMTTTNVEVCVDQDATTPAVVEVRQDGDVVGTVTLGASGATAGVQVPPGPVEAYVDGDLVGSGDLGEGGSISFSCSATAATVASTAEPEPTSSPSPTSTSTAASTDR